jgi:class 3 adenylate cyclase
MPLKADIEAEVGSIFGARWSERAGRVVPDPADIYLGSNDAVTFDAVTVLYADLSDSTVMVDTKIPKFSAEVYKAFLATAGRIIQDHDGTITAYDGDRIMAVYLGECKNTNAAKTGLKLNHAVNQILMPALRRKWNATDFSVRHVVGIDTSKMFVARTGVRGRNDLVWVGRAANYAAKLTTGIPPILLTPS